MTRADAAMERMFLSGLLGGTLSRPDFPMKFARVTREVDAEGSYTGVILAVGDVTGLTYKITVEVSEEVP